MITVTGHCRLLMEGWNETLLAIWLLAVGMLVLPTFASAQDDASGARALVDRFTEVHREATAIREEALADSVVAGTLSELRYLGDSIQAAVISDEFWNVRMQQYWGEKYSDLGTDTSSSRNRRWEVYKATNNTAAYVSDVEARQEMARASLQEVRRSQSVERAYSRFCSALMTKMTSIHSDVSALVEKEEQLVDQLTREQLAGSTVVMTSNPLWGIVSGDSDIARYAGGPCPE